MRKKLSLVLFIIIAVNATFAQNITRIDGSRISADSLTRLINKLMQKANVSGLGISVFNHNKPVFTQTFGYADVPEKKVFRPDQVLYGASLSKAVFGYIVAQMVQEKVIDLDKPLVKYLSKPLPDYKFERKTRGYQDIAGDKRYEKITARMCLDHTTGFPNWRWFEGDKKLKIRFEPGARYSYSGEGLYLLQFVIEQVTGQDYETIAQQRVFKPLNMVNSSYVWQSRFDGNLVLGHDAGGKPYELSKPKTPNCAGSLSTTLDDYTSFFTALMQHQGFSKKTFNQMISPQVRIRSIKQFGPLALKDSTLNDNIQLSYGLAFGVLKTPFGRAFFKEGHDDGWGHYTIAFPDKQTGIVILTNNDNGESIFKELLAVAIGDTYSPWFWENYIPYDMK